MLFRSTRPPRVDALPPARRAAPAWGFRPDIEGLRAIAVVAVVLFHAGVPAVRSGYLGVDVFFVLSGFLISGILLDEAARMGTISLPGFWARRARRLLPAAAVLIAAVLVADAVLASPMERAVHAHSARAAALYGSNVLFALRSRLYFGPVSERDPLLHTWSLGVEEQFYLVFAPLLLLLVARGARGGAAVLRGRLAALAGAGVLVSFALCLASARMAPAWAFYLLPTRAWEFGAGALCAVSAGGAVRDRPRAREAAAWLGAAGLVAAMLVDARGTWLSHPGTATLLPVGATAALIWAGGGAAAPFVSRALGGRGFRVLGRLSYSWYLWHWPALVFLRLEAPAAPVGLRLAVAAAALIPAALTYALVENPVRYSAVLRPRPALALAGAVLLTLALAGAAQLAGARAGRVYASPRYAAVREAARLWDLPPGSCELRPGAVPLRVCVRPAPGSDTTLVLLGDSHAGQWLPAVVRIAERRHWRVLALTRGGCPAASVTVRLRETPVSGNAQCDTWRREALRWAAAQRPRLVVLGSLRRRVIHVGGGRYLAADGTDAGRAAWSAGLRQTARELAASGARVVVLQDTPFPEIDVRDCVARNPGRPHRCDVPAEAAVDRRFARAEREAIAGIPGTAYVDMTPAICGPRVCAAETGGVIRFRDTNHVTARVVEGLWPQLETALDAALRAPASAPPRQAARRADESSSLHRPR